MRDQRRHLGRALVAEVGKIGRQIEPAIVGHQILDAVEIAAEGEVVDALLAAAALPVQVDGDDRRAFGLADRVVPDLAGRGLELQVLLLAAHAERDVGALDAALRHLVALVDVARLAVVDDGIGAAVIATTACAG